MESEVGAEVRCGTKNGEVDQIRDRFTLKALDSIAQGRAAHPGYRSHQAEYAKGVAQLHLRLCNAFSVNGLTNFDTQGALRDPGLRNVTPSA